MASAEKGRYQDAANRRMYPMGALNSACARPLSAALAAMRLTPNAVSVLSLLVSLAGCALMGWPTGRNLLLAAALLHLGLLLDHADGQVARRRKMGSTWGMYLDMAIDRLVEVAIVVGLLAAELAGPSAPGPLPASWQPFESTVVALVAVAVMGLMMAWRFLSAYNDVLYLRSHLRQSGRLPDPDGGAAQPRRPVVPWVLNRDIILALTVAGIAVGQVQATLLGLGVLHVVACAEKMTVFRLRHQRPEGAAARVLADDYH